MKDKMLCPSVFLSKRKKCIKKKTRFNRKKNEIIRNSDN